MKQVILLLCICIAGIANAGNKSKKAGIDAITFYGVDFSLAKVCGASETPEKFKAAFTGINELFQKEPKKYDIDKAFKVKNSTVSLSTSQKLTSQIKESELFTENSSYSLTNEEIEAQIRNFNTGSDTGYGAIMIAGLLNKGRDKATYTVVIFNTTTKEIISQHQITSKAKGFGLRNFWAGSVYATLKQMMKL